MQTPRYEITRIETRAQKQFTRIEHDANSSLKALFLLDRGVSTDDFLIDALEKDEGIAFWIVLGMNIAMQKGIHLGILCLRCKLPRFWKCI